MSEPPRWTIRRTAAILAASILLLVVAGMPAWAGSSFGEPELEADADQGLTLTVTEPEDEAYGDTARVVVTAPSGFTVVSCDSAPSLWSCAVAEDGTRLTLTRTSPVAVATTRDFGFTVHTSPINGSYAFRVVQADGPPSEEDPPSTVTSRPVVTVAGGRNPEPSPKPSPSPSPPTAGGSQTDTGGTTSGGDAQTDGSQDDGTTQDGGDTGSDAGSDDTTSTGRSTSGGSTAPRRTQGRASGTTLEIIPGEPTGDEPDVARPDVADDPAIAPPADADAAAGDDAAAVAATGAQASEDPRGTPWQQWVGAAMLLAGGAVVAVRRWDLADRLRELEPLELLGRWRR